MSHCRSCHAVIIWAETASGKMMPVDAEHNPDGTVVLIEQPDPRDPPLSSVISKHNRKDGAPYVGERHTSHFATCPQAGSHRKGNAK